jgi:hypothetical protein
VRPVDCDEGCDPAPPHNQWTLHHRDLIAYLPDAAKPPAEGLARSREMLEIIAGAAFPLSFSDKDALLVGTGPACPDRRGEDRTS